MSKKRLTIVASLLSVFLVTVSAFSAAQNVKVKGMISGRTGETLILNTQDGTATVILDDSTKVQQPKGLGLRKKQVSAAVLIPGLKVSVDGTGDSTNVTAKTITFDKNDLATAEMIQAGLHPTAEQVAERVAQFEAAGVELVLLQFSPQLEEMEGFATAVIGRPAGARRES